MKKLLLLAAFGVAGLMSAKGYLVSLTIEQNVEAELSEHDWLVVETWCGKVFYLDNNHYSSFEEIAKDADYFTDQQCGPY